MYINKSTTYFSSGKQFCGKNARVAWITKDPS